MNWLAVVDFSNLKAPEWAAIAVGVLFLWIAFKIAKFILKVLLLLAALGLIGYAVWSYMHGTTGLGQ